MQPADYIAQLRDIHIPPQSGLTLAGQINFWPIAVALLAIVVLLALAVRRRTAWRRQAKAELARIAALGRSGQADVGWCELALLLRRLLIRLRGRKQIAALAGEAWLQQLDEVFACDEFSRGAGRDLLSSPYMSGNDNGVELERLTSIVRRALSLPGAWIRSDNA